MCLFLLLAAAVPAVEPSNPSAAASANVQEERDTPVQLNPYKVHPDEDDDYDTTGLDSYEREMLDQPFTNELVVLPPVEDAVADVQLAQIANPSPVNLATGDARLSLRGFPTPLLRNGCVTLGASDMLNTSRMVVIQGALVPVMGRAAPGGIQDFWTARPTERSQRRADFSFAVQHAQQTETASLDVNGVTVPNRSWHHITVSRSHRVGPETFATNDTTSADVAVAWKHTKTMSTLWSVDVQEVSANAAPGIPEYRVNSGERVIGPYLPLAGFNVYGPNSGIRRRTGSASVWFDAQPHPWLTLRAGLEGWWRSVEQDRFTTGVYNLATAHFDGTREPSHAEQPQTIALAHFEATGRFDVGTTAHKLMFATSQSRGTYSREERALSVDLRDSLPDSVQYFSPNAPDYFRPNFSRSLYSRVLAERDEQVSYTSLELTERMASSDGDWVLTTGLRQDFVGLDMVDRTPGAVLPRVADDVAEFTYHAGANYQAVPGRLLLFATGSTAFDPSTRVDARTGKIQGNETTRGYETGLKSRLEDGLFVFSASGFLLYNQHISRRNPLFDDPVYDANQTQPELVADGAERFSGGKLEGQWDPAGPWVFSARAAYTRAITTASPDLPEEVGRPLTRLPAYTASATSSYAVPTGRFKGLALAATWSYVASYVAQYETTNHYGLQYPGYGLLTLSGNWRIQWRKIAQSVGLMVRNVGNYDMVKQQARLGNSRELAASYQVAF